MANRKKTQLPQNRPEVSERVQSPAKIGAVIDRPQHRPAEEKHGIRAADDQSTGKGKPGMRTPKGAQRSKKKTEEEWKLAG